MLVGWLRFFCGQASARGRGGGAGCRVPAEVMETSGWNFHVEMSIEAAAARKRQREASKRLATKVGEAAAVAGVWISEL